MTVNPNVIKPDIVQGRVERSCEYTAPILMNANTGRITDDIERLVLGFQVSCAENSLPQNDSCFLQVVRNLHHV